MPTVKLTKSAIDTLPVLSKDTVYWDAGLPGFGVKVTPKGKKVFIVLYRTGGAGSRLRKYTIGPYGRITPAMARAQAQKIFAARLDGRDPAAEKANSKRRQVVDRVDGLVEAFIAERLSSLRSGPRVARRLRGDVIPRWGTKSIHEIKRRDIIDLVSEVGQRGLGANRNIAKVLKTFFRWCVGRAVIDFSPVEGLSLRPPDRIRDRALDDRELAAVILTVRQMPAPFGAILEVLALTGQRREEVAQMAWNEIDVPARIWHIPSQRSKNAKGHLVHLSDTVWGVINGMPRHSRFVFATSAGKNFQSFKRAKTNLDRLSGVIEWRLHDLRRTVVTGMARLGVPPHVADKILNHQSGTISGVAAVYQKHEFLVERKDALERWSRHVTDIIGSSSGSNPVSETGMNLETPNRDVSQRRSNKSDLTGCCGPGQLKEELDLYGASYGEKAPAAWRNHCVTLPK
jgi:integrase